MVEIQQMIVRAKVNGEFDETDQELIQIVEGLVEEKIKNLGGLSKNEKKQLKDDNDKINITDKTKSKIFKIYDYNVYDR